MTYDKALIISRYHDDLANPIYNAYIKGIESQCSIIHFIDYFDQIGALGKKGFEAQVEEILFKEKIHLIFFIFVSGDPILDPFFIQKIAAKRFIAMVFWDTEQFFEQIDRYYAQLADLVILPANYEYVYKLQALNINAICPFSLFDSTKYKPAEETSSNIDVSFVGEVTKGKRKEYISYLEDNGINIEAYGSGTKNGKVSFERVVEIFNTSKINLSFTGTYANDVYSFCSNINNRILQNKGKPIEIALCGGFVLTEYVPGIEKVFEPDTIDTFLTKETLLEKVKYYLSHEQQRSEMAKAAYLHAKKNYDCIEGFKKIFQRIESITPKEHKTVILDTIFLKIHTTFHTFYFITFLLQKRFSLAFEEAKIILKYRFLSLHDIKNYLYHEKIFYMQKRKFQKDFLNLINLLRNQKVVIYGAGIHTLSLFEIFPQLKKLNITAIADKNPSLWGKRIHNITIVAPDTIPMYGNDIVISSFAFEKEIYSELKSILPVSATIHKLYSHTYTFDFVSKQSLKQRQRTDPYQIFRNTLKLR
ncbi:MAG: glycosyltransferase [Candidatus Cloacimonetes bacterium]|nr:glycosyltransferase [Candidatus Cloacimonadota bacterium]